MRDPASSPSLAAGLVFVASAAVLVVEILGIRLLAPYVGLTLETTTAIIGTVLAGIAAGSALGGRAADRVSPRLLLPVLLAAGGALAIATVPLVRLFGEALRGGGDAAALVIALTALLPPATALSAVTPAVVKAPAARPRRDRLGRRPAVGLGDDGRARRDVRDRLRHRPAARDRRRALRARGRVDRARAGARPGRRAVVGIGARR